MYNSYGLSSVAGVAVWIIISAVLAVVGGIVGYYFFVRNTKKEKNQILEKIKLFFDFKQLLIEDILKICYMITAIFITLGSFALIGESFLGFIAMLVGGNVIARIFYEALMLVILIWKNTNDINKKMK